ncbi:MAG: hypothetical protein KA198_01130 [Chitinophagaceae bacterium]|nr:hypothetical protein [Chitinophagaceae bacterium]
MKQVLILIATLFLLNSCVQQDPIPQNELTGIWKLNGYPSTNYKVEITPDGYLYWFSYNDMYNRVEEFEVDYRINQNSIYLYYPGGNNVRHILYVYRERNGRLYFNVEINTTDPNGNPIRQTDTYYLMN